MSPLPQKPKSSHTKKSSVMTSRSVETGDGDNMRPAGRRKRQMRKFTGEMTVGIELDPRPSDDVDDPLVSLPIRVEVLRGQASYQHTSARQDC